MILDGLREFNRLVSAEGMVLLENDRDILPICNEKTAVFGRAQLDYYKCGAGSGGAVNSIYTVNILEGMRNNSEIIVDEELADFYEKLIKDCPDPIKNLWSDNFTDCEPVIDETIIKNAAEKNQKAIIIISRLAGESYDTKNEVGGYLLTPNERLLISQVGKYFDKYAVLLNSGNIMDMQWVMEENVPCVMYVWHGGEEGGNAVADVLSGIVPPSGRLTDTIAKEYTDYPSSNNFRGENEIKYCEDIYIGYRWFETFDRDKVLYPFGYGLSYTEFEINCIKSEKKDNIIELDFSVKNIGKREGREVVQVYAECGYDKLSRPSRELVGFAKTKTILPGQEETVKLCIDITKAATYDDVGTTGYKSAWVLEKGIYNIYGGSNVRTAQKVFSYELKETVVVEQLTQRMTLTTGLRRVINNGGKPSIESLCAADTDNSNRTTPTELLGGYEKDFGQAVKEDRIAEFVGTMTNEELITIARGEGMLSPKVTPGVASCFGGVSDELLEKGIPIAATADGPSGIRMDNGETASSMPCGTLLASTWDIELVKKLYELCGKELELNKIDMLLGPGMNIHRNPLCGRNFEYFSEDPLLTGMIGAACVNGLSKSGAVGVIKHFACNNREYQRHIVNAVVSERALREIYLRGFEIAVKTSPVRAIMTSYNPVNGYQSASNYDLTTSVLRDEWGYNGMVMTDWWATMNYFPDDKAEKTKIGAMIKAQNDVYMVVKNFMASGWEDDAYDAMAKGIITRAELQRNTVNILKVISTLLCFEREYGFRNNITKNLFNWFEVAKNDREYKTIKCSIPKDVKIRKPFVFIGDFLVIDKDPISCYNAIGGAGDEMKFSTYTPKETEVTLKLKVSADASDLAQFAVYAKNDGKEYPIPFCGTDNKTIEVGVEINLPLGYSDIILSFGNSNPMEATLHEISLVIQ